MVAAFTPSQINTIQITERVSSIASLLGIFFILATFLLGRGFDKPINRLIFFASFSNLGANVATLIAEDGPAAGANSPLCQFQAWAIQMFLGVDVFWALCMALNVYLALFRGWTAKRMRAQEWKYILGCYGAAFVPALIYLFIDTKSRGKVYGPALLWCWITTKWNFLRLLTLYAIVWAAFLCACVIYCLAIKKVWGQRHELSGLFNPFNEDPFSTKVTTEIEVVYEEAPVTSPYSQRSPIASPFSQRSGYFGNVTPHGTPQGEDPPPLPGKEEERRGDAVDPYNVNIEAGKIDRRPSRPELYRVRTFTREAALRETNADAWLYARVAFLFFLGLLISWIPASVNRLYALVHPHHLSYSMNWVQALLLPLQGFFNFWVYVITSQTAVRNLFRAFTGKPQLPRKTTFGDGTGLDAATGDKGVKTMSMNVNKVAAGLTRHERVESRLDRFSRRPSEREGRQRLDSEVSSLTEMPIIHAK